MPDHDPNVAAVLEAGFVRGTGHAEWDGTSCPILNDSDELARDALAALTEAGYAVVKLPPGLEVEHGARLVESEPMAHNWYGLSLYAIEPPNEAP